MYFSLRDNLVKCLLWVQEDFPNGISRRHLTSVLGETRVIIYC
jgi:hypothetical protein